MSKARLAAPQRAFLMQFDFNVFHGATREVNFQKLIDPSPPETSLKQCPSFVDDVIGRNQTPLFTFGTEEQISRLGMKWVRRLNGGVKARCVNEDDAR